MMMNYFCYMVDRRKTFSVASVNLLTTSVKPDKKSSINPNLYEFWEVRDCLSYSDGVILMKHCITIPKALLNQILQNLHDAHQGTTDMPAHADQTVNWPVFVIFEPNV